MSFTNLGSSPYRFASRYVCEFGLMGTTPPNLFRRRLLLALGHKHHRPWDLTFLPREHHGCEGHAFLLSISSQLLGGVALRFTPRTLD